MKDWSKWLRRSKPEPGYVVRVQRVDSCKQCPHQNLDDFGFNPDGICDLKDRPIPDSKGRPSWCPLSKVPLPGASLSDA